MLRRQHCLRAPSLRIVFGRASCRALAAQSGAANAAGLEVVRSEEAGLLVRGTESKGDPLRSGSLVQHSGGRFVCVFNVDSYWFAAPLRHPGPDSDRRSLTWLGTPGAGATTGSSSEAASASSAVVRAARESVAREVDLKSVVTSLRCPTPTQQERAPLSQALHTGIIAVDTLAPLGRGQSLLVCGPCGSGKSTLAREIIEQALTGQLVDQALRFRMDPCAPLVSAALQSPGSFAELTVSPQVVVAEPAVLLVPMLAAVAAAEASRDAGRHTLLVLDTIEPLLSAWRLAVRWAEEASGRSLESEAAQVQRRGCFSGLLERAATLLPGKGGGSLTLLALAETEAMAALGTSAPMAAASSADAAAIAYSLEDFAGRKKSDLLRLERLAERGIALTDAALAAVGIAPPSGKAQAAGSWVEEVAAMRELQSLSDGQVVLDGGAAEQGQFPALAHGATFSRFGLGGASDSGGSPAREVQEAGAPARQRRDVRAPALQAVSAHLRVELALLREACFRPSDTSGATDILDAAHAARMRAVCAALQQAPRTPMLPEEMVALLLVACGGALDALSEAEAAAVLRGGANAPLLAHLRQSAPKVLTRISEEQHVSVASAKELEVAVRLFLALQKAEVVSEQPAE